MERNSSSSRKMKQDKPEKLAWTSNFLYHSTEPRFLVTNTPPHVCGWVISLLSLESCCMMRVAMDPSSFKTGGLLLPTIEMRCASPPSVIVIGSGISGIAVAHVLSNSSFEVTVLESIDRIGGHVHTDYSFGCPIDMGASCCSLFDKNGLAVPMEIAAKVGVIFEKILKEKVKPRDEQEHDMRLEQAISMVLERHPDLNFTHGTLMIDGAGPLPLLAYVGTALSNPYLSFAEALNGLAGPQQSQPLSYILLIQL
uniref:Putative polyamine oxidase 4 n=1 Tax=Aegilops tauschii TaxID=37682 RepID=M8B2L7_AEGTA